LVDFNIFSMTIIWWTLLRSHVLHLGWRGLSTLNFWIFEVDLIMLFVIYVSLNNETTSKKCESGNEV
jgi:hypothetical protein